MEATITTLPVDAPGGGYDVLLGSGLLGSLPALLDERGLGMHTAVVTNEMLAPLYGRTLVESLEDAFLVTVPEGEQYKTLDTVRDIYDALIAGGLGRDGLLLTLGGGVVGDMAGFAAASYKRGVHLVQVPTSLLAMVDASVGGKVGVDLPAGKNLVGAFKQPDLVAIDPSTLDTLPPEELVAGLAEVVKAGLIADAGLLDVLTGDWERVEVIKRALAVKIDVVQADPFEANVRAHLNLGHTFAHAIEVCSDYSWRHGEAVAVGLAMAARLSARLGMADEELCEQVEKLLAHVGLPITYHGAAPETLWEAMAHDKKVVDSKRRFILLREAGQIEIVTGVPRNEVLAVLEQFGSESA